MSWKNSYYEKKGRSLKNRICLSSFRVCALRNRPSQKYWYCCGCGTKQKLHSACRRCGQSWQLSSYKNMRFYVFLYIFRAGADPGGGGGAPGMRPPLKLEKIWFFGVKSWFFTRNTPKMFEPPSAWHNFFKCVPPPTWNPGSAPAELSQIKNYRCHCGLWNWKKLHSTSRRCGLSWQLSSYKNMSVIFFFLIWVLQVWPSQNLLMSLWFVELKKKNSASRRCGQSWQVFFTV